jgi:hypothetical protein
VRRHGRPPQAPQHLSDDDILLELRQRTERRPRLAALQEHRPEGVISFEHSRRRVTIPEAQSVDLVLALHVRQSELQYCRRPPSTRVTGATMHSSRRDPRMENPG